ncbi:cyclin-like protein [Pyronema omphalodes]|nr:cyclin-like protein [Pyronema omphalodes]
MGDHKAPADYCNESQWLFTEEELRHTPSVEDGIPPELEREQRSKGCNFITQLGIQLKLPQITLATASTYLHRFYMQNSLKQHHYYETAAVCLFLATKVDENGRKFANIVEACVRSAQKNLTLVVNREDREYWRWKDSILNKEEWLLESLCFDLMIDLPYNHLLGYLKKVGKLYSPEKPLPKELARAAWTFINDSTLTMLCMIYPSRIIGAAALYCAAKHIGINFPDQDGKPWWETIGVKITEIKKCCNYMALVYENNPLKNDDRIKYVATPESTEGTKTRQQEPSSPLSEKRPRDASNGPEMENSDRKRPRIEDVRNGGEPPERTKGDRMDREDRGDRGGRASLETANSASRDNGDRASRERDDGRGRDVAQPASRPTAVDDQDLEEGEVDD